MKTIVTKGNKLQLTATVKPVKPEVISQVELAEYKQAYDQFTQLENQMKPLRKAVEKGCKKLIQTLTGHNEDFVKTLSPQQVTDLILGRMGKAFVVESGTINPEVTLTSDRVCPKYKDLLIQQIGEAAVIAIQEKTPRTYGYDVVPAS